MRKSPLSTQDRILEEVTNAYRHPVMNNVHRSDYVEAMVAVALEPDGWSRMQPWDGWDFEHLSGTRLEVKQSAAEQAWNRDQSGEERKEKQSAAEQGRNPSRIKSSGPRFDIAKRTGYSEGPEWTEQAGRHAQIYVFAWHAQTGKEADQRDPDQWRFFVLAKQNLPDQKTIGLEPLRSRHSAAPDGHPFCKLRDEVERVRKSLGRCPKS